MNNEIHVLAVEDNDNDFYFIKRNLKSVESRIFHIQRAIRVAEALEFLDSNQADVILLDLSLPDSTGLATFYEMYEKHPDIPIIILTGLNDSEVGLQAVQNGAQEYITKGELSSHLFISIISHAIERNKLLQKLENALKEVKTLQGFLPICSSCKKIRDDKGYWQQVEEYITTHSDTQFTHSICPTCTQKLYPDLDIETDQKN